MLSINSSAKDIGFFNRKIIDFLNEIGFKITHSSTEYHPEYNTLEIDFEGKSEGSIPTLDVLRQYCSLRHPGYRPIMSHRLIKSELYINIRFKENKSTLSVRIVPLACLLLLNTIDELDGISDEDSCLIHFLYLKSIESDRFYIEKTIQYFADDEELYDYSQYSKENNQRYLNCLNNLNNHLNGGCRHD